MTAGQGQALDPLLNFYSKLKSYTTIIEQAVNAPGEANEIICPQGTWCYELNAVPDVSPGGLTPAPVEFILFVNGGRVDISNNNTQNSTPNIQIYKKPGAPYLQVLDTLQIQNLNFVGRFQFIFHRVMLKDS
jgi:hypothetical protein